MEKARERPKRGRLLHAATFSVVIFAASACGIAARVQAQEDVVASKKQYEDCLRQHSEAPDSACESVKRIYETDLGAYQAISRAIQSSATNDEPPISLATPDESSPALVGWYLIARPLAGPNGDSVNPNAPMSQWMNIGSFDSAEKCQEGRSYFYAHTGEAVEEVQREMHLSTRARSVNAGP
jgi:hypothetical protein